MNEKTAIKKTGYALSVLILVFCVIVLVNVNSAATALTGYAVGFSQLFNTPFMIMQGISLSIVLLVIILMLVRKKRPEINVGRVRTIRIRS